MGLGLDGMQKMNGAINVDFMTEEEIHQKLEAGYKDMESGKFGRHRLYDTKQTIEQVTDFAKKQPLWDFISNIGYLRNWVLRLLA